MPETLKTLSELLASFPTSGAQEITAQRMRDFVASIFPAMGRYSLTATTPTSFADTVNYVKAEIGAGIPSGYERFFTYADGRLTYTGDVDIHTHVAVTITMSSGSNNQVASLRVVKNALPNDADAAASEADRKMGTGGDVGSTALHYDSMMSTGDYLEVWMRNQTSTADMTLNHVYFFILGMIDLNG